VLESDVRASSQLLLVNTRSAADLVGIFRAAENMIAEGLWKVDARTLVPGFYLLGSRVGADIGAVIRRLLLRSHISPYLHGSFTPVAAQDLAWSGYGAIWDGSPLKPPAGSTGDRYFYVSERAGTADELKLRGFECIEVVPGAVIVAPSTGEVAQHAPLLAVFDGQIDPLLVDE
jgi:hypothetical protein